MHSCVLNIYYKLLYWQRIYVDFKYVLYMFMQNITYKSNSVQNAHKITSGFVLRYVSYTCLNVFTLKLHLSTITCYSQIDCSKQVSTIFRESEFAIVRKATKNLSANKIKQSNYHHFEWSTNMSYKLRKKIYDNKFITLLLKAIKSTANIWFQSQFNE